MEYSSAEMTCVLKLNTQCETCKVKMMQILKNLTGVYSITIDGEEGTLKVTGRVNPSSLLGVLEKYERHGELKFIRFDGEVKLGKRQSYYYYNGEHEYAPYGMLYNNNNGTYPPPPPLGYPHQHHWYHHHHQGNLGFFPPPMAPPRPPPMAMPFRVAPPFPPPMAPFWHLPQLPLPFSQLPRGLAQRGNEKLGKKKAHKHCTIM